MKGEGGESGEGQFVVFTSDCCCGGDRDRREVVPEELAKVRTGGTSKEAEGIAVGAVGIEEDEEERALAACWECVRVESILPLEAGALVVVVRGREGGSKAGARVRSREPAALVAGAGAEVAAVAAEVMEVVEDSILPFPPAVEAEAVVVAFVVVVVGLAVGLT